MFKGVQTSHAGTIECVANIFNIFGKTWLSFPPLLARNGSRSSDELGSQLYNSNSNSTKSAKTLPGQIMAKDSNLWLRRISWIIVHYPWKNFLMSARASYRSGAAKALNKKSTNCDSSFWTMKTTNCDSQFHFLMKSRSWSILICGKFPSPFWSSFAILILLTCSFLHFKTVLLGKHVCLTSFDTRANSASDIHGFSNRFMLKPGKCLCQKRLNIKLKIKRSGPFTFHFAHTQSNTVGLVQCRTNETNENICSRE